MLFRHRLPILILILGMFILFNNSLVYADNDLMDSDEDFIELWEKARVISIEDLDNEFTQNEFYEQQMVEVKILSGKYKGETLEAQNTLSGSVGWDLNLQVGDEVIIFMSESDEGLKDIYIADFSRSKYINLIIYFFIFIVILVGGFKGIKSLVALGFTALAVYSVLLPSLLKGYAPLPITIGILTVVILLTMIIIAGFSKKALAATVGTIGGVIVAGVLAYIFGDLAQLSGFADEESRMLLYVENLEIDMKGLLLSGIIIGALGATMDVAMSIASSVEEIKKANPDLTFMELIKAGMNVGRDIMGTMVNTLILAYTGGALPVLLLFMAYETSSTRIMNSEMIATEIVRALAGSIGLILSVPITAVVAGLLAKGGKKTEQADSNII